MVNTTTHGGVLRAYGGDRKRGVVPGSVKLVVPFYIDPTEANTTVATYSAVNTREVVLPPGAIVTQISANAAATGGSSPTFDLGWVAVITTATKNVDGLVAEGDADAGGSVFTMATTTAGAEFGAVMSSTEAVKITGGVGASAGTGGAITGHIEYYVTDDGADLT